jgi:hypothetical protein
MNTITSAQTGQQVIQVEDDNQELFTVFKNSHTGQLGWNFENAQEDVYYPNKPE